MKKHIIRTLCLLLAAMTVLAMAACGQTADPGSSSTDPATTTASGTPAATEPETTERLDDYGRPYLAENIPDNLDYQNRQFNIHIRGGVDQYEWNAPEENGEALNDSIFRRNSRVEDLLKIKINTIAEGSWSNYNSELLPKIKASVQTGDGAYDLLAGYGSVTSLATEGLLYNLSNLQYIDFTQPWWSSSFNDAINIQGMNFFGVGALSLSMIYSMECIFVNKTLLADCAGDGYNIYDTVLQNKWTYEEVEELSKKVWIDSNNNGVADAGDTVGLTYPDDGNTACGLFFGTGVSLSSHTNDGLITFSELDATRTTDIIDAIIKLMYQTEGTPAGGTEKTILFPDGTSLFNFRWLYWGQTQYAGQMEEYGIVPIPKWSADQENYRTNVQAGMHMYCIPTDVNNVEENSIIVEALAAESYRSLLPAYFEVVLKSRYAKDAQTSRMLDLMYETVAFDFAYIFRSDIDYWSGLQGLITSKSNGFGSVYKSISDYAGKKLTKLLDSIIANAK